MRAAFRASGLTVCAACALFLVKAPRSLAVAPTLETGVLIQDSGSSLVVQYCAVPRVVDWNNDGKKDLVIGQYTNGNVRLYLNQGTNTAPVFNGFTLIQSGGVPITTSFS
jgi:hypothetical protein